MNIQDRIKEVLSKEAAAITAVNVTDEFEKAVKVMKKCKGKILTTGIGKAGLIARKFAATLCSTLAPAVFVHPAETAHGDLGIIDKDDCVIAFSTSGKSNEVIGMLENGRDIGLKTIIGITSHPDSALRELSDIIIDMGVIKEPCTHGLAPSSSTTVMLAISDALALALMDLRGVTKEQYGMRHKGGYLGQKARDKG